jgi:hypothetical protein
VQRSPVDCVCVVECNQEPCDLETSKGGGLSKDISIEYLKMCSVISSSCFMFRVDEMSANLLFIPPPGLNIPSGLDLLYVVPQLHSAFHTQYDSPGRVIGPSQDPLPDHAQHSQEADTHHPGRIRNHNPGKRAAAEPRLRQLDHRDLLAAHYLD